MAHGARAFIGVTRRSISASPAVRKVSECARERQRDGDLSYYSAIISDVINMLFIKN